MLRNLYFLGVFLLVLVSSSFAQVGSGTLKGKLTDAETGEPLPFVNIVVQEGGRQVTGGATDINGDYTIKPIEPGTYDVLVSYVGYNSKKISGVVINANSITFYNIKLEPGIRLQEFEVVEYEVPLIKKDGGSSGGTVTREDIQRMPGRSATSIAATVGGVQNTSDGLSIRGARTENTYYYIDGIKVRGSSALPKAAIQEVSVMTGGIPARYGDATGGIVSITTRGASSEYFGSVDILTSGFKDADGNGVGLDPYAHNQIEAVVSGPLLFRKDAEGNKTDPLIGFFLAGNYQNLLDQRPSAIGNYRIKQESLDQLLADPMDFSVLGFDAQFIDGAYIQNGQVVENPFFTNLQVRGATNAVYFREDDAERDDYEFVDARQNDRYQSASVSGKFDFAVSEYIDLSVSGNFNWLKDNIYSYQNSMFNYANNGQVTDMTTRGSVRFNHRFPNDEEAGGIKNAYYSLMADYTYRKQTAEDPTHKDDLFKYGYVGKFESEFVRDYTFVDSLGGYVHQGFRQIDYDFTPSDENADLAAITTDLYQFYDGLGFNIRTPEQVTSAGGLINGRAPNDIYNLFNAPGVPYNNYSFFNQDQFRVSGSGSADIGDHALTIGFEYEQYTERNFEVRPRGLWSIARLYTNSHINELNTTSFSEVFYLDGRRFYNYDRLIDLGSQYEFDRNLRLKLGLDPNGDDYIQVDALDPELFELDMFSADELLNSGNNYVDYYGYDYKGDIQTGNPTINDFFTEKDEFGNFTRPVKAFQPIYIAGYVMDKFAFDDIIFNVGVRVDRFDANQSVLKDYYVVGDAYSVGGQTTFTDLPSNIGEDYVIYLNSRTDQENASINGFRDPSTNTFYNADGEPVDDPTTLSSPTGMAPYLRSAGGEDLTAEAFKDYKPQINVMPRIAFSFPISDEAVFFAHYDILTQRPTGQNILNPIDYLFILNRTNPISNPNLQPTQTTDYELGFQQVVSRTSSLKIAAFYREIRDEIQVNILTGAYPKSYQTFDNFDFGTVKGLTLAYDLRRTGNISMRMSYTLQFANATGSNPTSSLNLINASEPLLRVIYPTDRDQRHLFINTLDFRYGEGADYNGPVIGDNQIFSNAGINIVTTLGSGTPYSQQNVATGDALITTQGTAQLVGLMNGARLPWNFSVDAQINKSWNLKVGGEGDEARFVNLDVYLLFSNLFNTQNVIGVYRYTGNPDDDGYLTSPQAQNYISSQIDPVSFRQLYSLKSNNPYNYATARTIQLGLKLNF